MTPLHRFLQAWNQPFVRGVSDCCGFVAAWLEIATGRPLDCRLLGRELSDAEACTILGVPGGLRELARRELINHGCTVREGEPQDGDIVVGDRVQGLSMAFVGIWSAGRIVSASRQGLRIVAPQSISNLSVYGH